MHFAFESNFQIPYFCPLIVLTIYFATSPLLEETFSGEPEIQASLLAIRCVTMTTVTGYS